MAADKMKEILKHFPDLEDGWKEMEEKLKAEPAEMEMLSIKYREMSQRESSKESLVESEFTKAKRSDSELKVMKANEAPEKLYLQHDFSHPAGKRYLNLNKLSDNDIEYIRTDAFIEKAKKWFEKRNEWFDIDGTRQCDMEGFEDFKKYMKL